MWSFIHKPKQRGNCRVSILLCFITHCARTHDLIILACGLIACRFFKNYREADYARSGFVPIETVERHPGPIEMTHVMEPTLRQLGML